MSVALVLWAGAEVFLGLKYFQLFKENIRMESVLPIKSIALTISVVTSFGILLAKGRFIYRILKARTDVNVFNHSIALCFAVSGTFFTFCCDLKYEWNWIRFIRSLLWKPVKTTLRVLSTKCKWCSPESKTTTLVKTFSKKGGGRRRGTHDLYQFF